MNWRDLQISRYESHVYIVCLQSNMKLDDCLRMRQRILRSTVQQQVQVLLLKMVIFIVSRMTRKCSSGPERYTTYQHNFLKDIHLLRSGVRALELLNIPLIGSTQLERYVTPKSADRMQRQVVKL